MTDVTRVLVGGAEGALGQVAVSFFAEHGCEVIASCRTAADSDRLSGTWSEKVALEVADLADYESVQGLFARQVDGGPIQVIFNAAGGFRYGALADCSNSDYEFLVAANQTSTYQLIHHGLRYWRERAVPGRYVGVSAAAATQGSAPANMAAYIASKRALNGLIEAAAAEVRAEGVTINAVAPTIIDTPANREAMPDADRSAWVTPAAIMAAAWELIGQADTTGQIKVLG